MTRPLLLRRGVAGLAAPVLAGTLAGACAIVPSDRAASDRAAPVPVEFDPGLTARPSVADVDLRVEARKLEPGPGRDRLLRVDFSYRAYDGWIAREDRHRATGSIWFPVDEAGRADPARLGEAIVTEWPPGVSASGFPFLRSYGPGTASAVGVPAAVVDVRGPVAADLRGFRNPDDPDDLPFRDEEQFALSMRGAWSESGDPELLHEAHVARAWRRAIEAVDTILEDETGASGDALLLVAQDVGAIGATRAAATDGRVAAIAVSGMPVDALDLERVRALRWEAVARVRVLDAVQPIRWRSDDELYGFLQSTPRRPDPGCPSCPGSGAAWRERFDYLTLRAAGRLEGVATLLVVGDSDPRFPIDLEARASLHAGTSVPLSEPSPSVPGPPPHPVRPGRSLYDDASRAVYLGPVVAATPFEDLVYVRGSSTLAAAGAVDAVRAFAQGLAGWREAPVIVVHRAIVDGDVRLDLEVAEGNAPVVSIDLAVTEIGELDRSDFKHLPHEEPGAEVAWQRVDARYVGHDARFVGWWSARTPWHSGRDRAWRIAVRTRYDDVETAHALPILVTWELGDPAPPPRHGTSGALP